MNIQENSKIAVIGYGSWATAIVGILTGNGHIVNWYIRNQEILESVVSDGMNSRYLPDLELDRDSISATDDLNKVVRESDILIMAMPSAYVRNFLEPLTESLDDKFIISAIKGIVPDSYLTVTEYFNKTYSIPYRRLGVVSGPTHAEEVSHGRMTYISVACVDESDAQYVGKLFENNHLRVNYTSDIYGIEYAAILKNIYAIAAGIATGLGYGDNFLAVLVSSCAQEMSRFLIGTNPSDKEHWDKNYLGDLLVTCYSSYSRNRRFGQLIGKGCTVKSALNEMTMIAEGYFAAEGIQHINKKHSIEMPIADMVFDVLYNKANARKAMKNLASQL